MRHAGIVPLIGGEILASDEAYGKTPEYLMTYTGFMNNEQHLIKHYKAKGKEIPYHVLDELPDGVTMENVDVVSSVCPCAGLSTYHNSHGEQNENNQWMEKSSEYVLKHVKPKVLWGENAPGLAGKIGKFMREKLYKIGQDNGYNFSIFLTKSLLHGNPQYRKRTFFFFWKKDEFNDSVPLFNYIKKERPTIQELILNADTSFQHEILNKKTPSKDDPYYRYLLEEVMGGMTHAEYSASVAHETKSVTVESRLLKMGIKHNTIAEWMDQFPQFEREAAKARRKHKKLEDGGGIMLRGTIIPVDYIGAFVVHLPKVIAHPVEDRYLSIAEAKAIMGLPSDLEVVDPMKNYNHICQNVPFSTAKDMALEVQACLNKQRDLIDTKYLFQNNLAQKYDYERTENSLENFL